MARNSTARRALSVVHPASNDKIERKAQELDEIRKELKKLTDEKDALNLELLRLVKRQGEADEDGKIRYDTDAHKFQIIEGRSVSTNGQKAIKKLVALGVSLKVAKKAIAAATTEKDYEYVRIDTRADDEGDGGEDRAS